MEKLKRCPFCGADVGIVCTAKELEKCSFDNEIDCVGYRVNGECTCFTVVCDFHKGGCGATSGYAQTIEKAIAKWNVRNDGCDYE